MLKFHKVLILFIILRETSYSSKIICHKHIFTSWHWINLPLECKKVNSFTPNILENLNTMFKTSSWHAASIIPIASSPFHTSLLWAHLEISLLFLLLSSIPLTTPCYQSISQSINQSINQSVSQAVSQSINQSINQLINQSISQSINQSINVFLKKVEICKTF